jgi:hypothetical protein
MSSHIRDGQPPESKLGSDEAVFPIAGEGDQNGSDTSVEMASREATRIRVLIGKVLFCYAAGQTRRWHAMEHMIRQETIAAHTWNVLMWIMLLHPEPSKNLLFAALVHDVAEHVAGDMPRWTKERLGGALERLEANVLDSKGLLVDLDEPDHEWLRAVDLFDAWMFLRQNLIAGNRLPDVMESYQRATRALSNMTGPKEVLEVFNALRWEK